MVKHLKLSGNLKSSQRSIEKKLTQLTDAGLTYETDMDNKLLNKVVSKFNKKRKEAINVIQKDRSKKTDTSPNK